MIFFKSEANRNVGAGHLHRSLTIAKECELNGIKSAFIFAESPTSSIKKVIDQGFKTYKIDKKTQYNSEEYLGIINPNSMIIFDTDDSNFYSGKLINELRNKKIKTACFSISDDDYIETDLLLNPNIISRILEYKTTSNTKLYLGPKFLIFRKEFLNVSRNVKKPRTLNNLLVMFGNADPYHLTLRFLDVILGISQKFKEVNIVAGILNPDLNELKLKINKLKNPKIRLHIDINNIIKLYENTDIAITAAGMAMWEMALFKIPQMIVASSFREVRYTNYLNELNYIYKLASFEDLPSSDEIKNNIENFLSGKINDLKIEEFQECIDPNGLGNIIKVIKQELHIT